MCILSAALPYSPSNPPPPHTHTPFLYSCLLVNCHISIFISQLPQLKAVKCLQAFYFPIFPVLYRLVLLYSVLDLVSCTNKVTSPFDDTCTWAKHNQNKKSITVYQYYFHQQTTSWMGQYSKAMNGYLNKVIDPSEQQLLKCQIHGFADI